MSEPGLFILVVRTLQVEACLGFGKYCPLFLGVKLATGKTQETGTVSFVECCEPWSTPHTVFCKAKRTKITCHS